MMKIVFKNGESLEVGDVIGNEISKSIVEKTPLFIRVADEEDKLLLLLQTSEVQFIVKQ